MESTVKYRWGSQLQSAGSLKQRSGYEPSDTETDWQESPSREHNREAGLLGSEYPKLVVGFTRNTNLSPLKLRPGRSSQKVENGSSPPKRVSEAVSVRRRHNSKSPYKTRNDDAGNPLSSNPGSDFHRNLSPFSKLENRRHISPYKQVREEREPENNNDLDAENIGRKQNRGTPTRDERSGLSPFPVANRASTKSNYSQRSKSVPKPRIQDREQNKNYGQVQQKGERSPSPLPRSTTWNEREVSPLKTPLVGEINEIVANLKLNRAPTVGALNFESTESIAPGDIFFSRDHTALAKQNNALPKNNGSHTYINPVSKEDTLRETNSSRWSQLNEFDVNPPRNSSRNSVSRMRTNYSSSVSRQSSSRLSTSSSKMSDTTARTTDSMKNFTVNRRKSHSEPWFACMRGYCKTSKTPETKAFDEASFIEKAFVVETLRQFWADKHRPGSLDGFTVHRKEAQLLKQMVSGNNVCPHILFQGPSGSGKRALAMALLREIYGDQSWNVSHELRYFQIQEKRQMHIAVPLTSSVHHVELNVHTEPNARYALMALVKEINSYHAVTPEISADLKADYKVIVLYDVDKAAESIQHLIKWIIDCYSDACKLILCSEDDGNILESVKSRCNVLKVDAPIAHEIMEILIQIARKEGFELSMNFAAKIATKSKQNIRKAIMALEACKAHNYPIVDDQPIPMGWEDVLVELASEILADPSPKRLFFVRGKIQKLLVDFVHPTLILQKLVEQFHKGVDSGSRRELYYWHAYYEKRLPTGTTALLKLEEFVAKFMSTHRKSSGRHHTSIYS